jgi:hypothetical protein
LAALSTPKPSNMGEVTSTGTLSGAPGRETAGPVDPAG